MKETVCTSKVKIGSLTRLVTENLLIEENEEASVHLQIEEKKTEAPLKLKIDFQETDDEEKKPNISIQGEEDGGRITFINWGLSLNSSTKKPIKFATSEEGDSLFFMALGTKSGNTYDLKIQFMTDLGGQDE